jgi:hypothetical protein
VHQPSIWPTHVFLKANWLAFEKNLGASLTWQKEMSHCDGSNSIMMPILGLFLKETIPFVALTSITTIEDLDHE